MGHGDLVGGTGKYANITGQCSYETRYLSTSILVATYDCAWSQSQVEGAPFLREWEPRSSPILEKNRSMECSWVSSASPASG